MVVLFAPMSRRLACYLLFLIDNYSHLSEKTKHAAAPTNEIKRRKLGLSTNGFHLFGQVLTFSFVSNKRLPWTTGGSNKRNPL